MNYLAHLYFSDPEPLAWSGSLMGDFLKGPIPDSLPAQLVDHLRLHRRIDSFTQQSGTFQRSRRRLDPRFRYTRSVLIDVYFDHLLARRWDEFSSQSLELFAQQVYRGLEDCFALLPETLQNTLPRIVTHNWLLSYRQTEIVERVLQRMEQRLSRPFPLAEGYHDLIAHHRLLNQDFSEFMAELEELVPNWKAEFRSP